MKLPRLKEVREQHGWSQQKLSEESGVSRDSISNYETGQREAWPATAKRLSNALGVEIADLVAIAPKVSVSPSEQSTAGGADAFLDEEELQSYSQEQLLELKDKLLDEYRELHPGPRTREDFLRPETPEEAERMDRFFIVSGNLAAVLRVLERTAGPRYA